MPEAATAGPVPREALAYIDGKDLRVGFDYRDVWLDEHAHAFTVAKVTRLDLLDDLKQGIRDALAQGKTLRQFADELRPTLQKKGWWGIKEMIDPATGELRQVQLGSPRRLQTIYRANLRSARAAGQWARIQRTKRARPFLIYELGPSENHRPEHVSWSGTVLPVDDPWWQAHYPPNGWGCKCRVRQIGNREAERLGGRSERPNDGSREWTNDRTGEVQRVPAGVDPAWANNPGQARLRVVRERLTQQLDTVDQAAAHRSVQQLVASPAFGRFRAQVRKELSDPVQAGRQPVNAARNEIGKRIGEIPIAVVDRDLQQRIGSQFQVVRLSAADLDKEQRRHPEVDQADFQDVQTLLDTGTIFRQPNGRLAAYITRGGKRWRAVLKQADDKIYLNSYQPLRNRDYRRDVERGELIRRGR